MYGPLYIDAVSANPQGAALVHELRTKLAAGARVLLCETDGPTASMLGVDTDATTGVTLRATPDKLRSLVSAHTADPVGHCFFLAAHLQNVTLEAPIPSSDVRTVGETRDETMAALRPKKRARGQ